MNAPVQTNMKAELLATTVEHIDITSFDARPIIDSMRKMSFSSRDTARAADIFNMALEDKDCSPWRSWSMRMWTRNNSPLLIRWFDG